MLLPALLLSAVVGARPADVPAETMKLLKTFREEFVEITPGKGKFPKTLKMGRAEGGQKSERPVHRVTFGHDFAVAKYEMPQDLYAAVIGKNPSRWKGRRNAVDSITHDEAVAFCRRATALMRAAKVIDPRQEIRLPTEAEWEYAARAGTTTIYSFGDQTEDLTAYAWYTGNAASNDPAVGVKKPNPWGLYDIHGYEWEWCSDRWHETYEGAPTDGSSWTADIKKDEKKQRRHVIRGGSWKDKDADLTSSSRRGKRSDFRDPGVGFRCVLSETR